MIKTQLVQYIRFFQVRCIYTLLVALLLATVVNSQSYVVEKASFSTANDEFAPVFYKNGLVYCSNQRINTLTGYIDDQSPVFNMFFIALDAPRKKPLLFARELSSGFHDGPATFNSDGNMIYFSRNNHIDVRLRNSNDSANKLGIYYAQQIEGEWTKIEPFAYNDPNFIFSTPALSPDGLRFYFSSDMAGGYGGMDLYYCNKCGDKWCEPVNMGSLINTPENESFPFADYSGKVYFSSNGHSGLGGKDIFFTMEKDDIWIDPVHLDAPINSPADDYAIFMDSTANSGYFSSNRISTDDIFSLSMSPPQFTSCDTIKESNYCFSFYDERHSQIDTSSVVYSWDFGNGNLYKGSEVSYCFPGPGHYVVKLDIFDELTGNPVASGVEYEIDLNPEEQVYISSANIGISGKPISFDAGSSNLGDVIITDYFWSFGEGFTSGHSITENVFDKSGNYTVRVGLLSSGLEKYCTSKGIRVYDAYDVSVQGVNASSDWRIQVLTMDDLSRDERSMIADHLKGIPLSISPDSRNFLAESWILLDKVALILKAHPEIRLEVQISSGSKTDVLKSTELIASELIYYLKAQGADAKLMAGRGVDMNAILHHASPDNTKGTVELIFMKK